MVNENKFIMSEMYQDAIKELGNIGAGHAATALSQLIKKSVMISVSSIDLSQVNDQSYFDDIRDKRGVAVSLKISGDIMGSTILLLSWENALSLCDIIKLNEIGTTKELSEMDISVLKESGSILTASYMRAVGNFINTTLIPTVPELTMGVVGIAVDTILSSLSKQIEINYCITTKFLELTTGLCGYILFIPKADNLKNLIEKI